MFNPFEAIMEKLNSLERKMEVLTAGAPSESPPEIIDREELCKRLDISVNTVRTWEKKGKIPYLLVGGNFRYNWPKVVDALGKRKK